MPKKISLIRNSTHISGLVIIMLVSMVHCQYENRKRCESAYVLD